MDDTDNRYDDREPDYGRDRRDDRDERDDHDERDDRGRGRGGGRDRGANFQRYVIARVEDTSELILGTQADATLCVAFEPLLQVQQ